MTEPTTMPPLSEAEKLTPAMRQFVEFKAQYPNTLMLFRLGDFYETFFDDAIRINRLIGITLTKRGKLPDGAPIPMAGIPMVSLDQYIERLVAMGESLVIAEQFGVPGQGLMERKIARIITPGTLTDQNLLKSKEDASLCAVTPPRGKKGERALVWLTLSNGTFEGCVVDDQGLESELARLRPAEILIDEKEKAELRARFSEWTFTSVPRWHFDGERGAEKLKTLFHLEALDAWGLEGETLLLSGINALLDYTEETQVNAMPYLRPFKRHEATAFVRIDAASRRNLEIVATLRRDEKGPTLLSVLDHCQTGMGTRELRRRLEAPLLDTDAVLARQGAVETLVSDVELADYLTAALKPLPDLERISARIALRRVRPKELAALRDALPGIQALGTTLTNHTTGSLAQDGGMLTVSNTLFEMLDAMLLDEPATLLRDGDVLKASAHEELATLRDLRDNNAQYLLDLEARERDRSGLPSLRVDYNRVQGFFIEVPKGQAGNVPEDYRRTQTLKNVERFTTPELKTHENAVLSAKERVAQLERVLYEGLLDTLQAWVEPLMNVAQAVANVDTALSLATHARQYQWVAPELTQKSTIDIENARHPVVETTLETFVPNSCHLGDGRRCLIITGPNMGGKSTYMRSVALITLLARMGSFVPATHATIGPIDQILTRIGASDDLARGRSTFMVEMTEAAQILHNATDHSLVLMDEIGRGTATFDGLSLAGAIAEFLITETRSLTLFATHYFELTALAARLSEAANVHVSATQTKKGIVFLHDIAEGPASRSYGIAVAQLAGIPAGVVRRAKAMMQKLEDRDAEQTGAQAALFAEGWALPETPEPEPLPLETPQTPDSVLALLGEMAQTDLDTLSPREALALLYGLQEKAESALKDCE